MRLTRSKLGSGVIASLIALAAVAAGLPGTSAEAAMAHRPMVRQKVTLLCAKDAHMTTKSRVDIRNNNFLGEPECLTNWFGAPGFTITKSGVHTPWGAFPNTFTGCEISVCSPHSGMPIQVAEIQSLSTTWLYSLVSRWKGNAAYDVWFDPLPRTRGEDMGAELMIWLDSNKLSIPSGPTVNIDGALWRVSRGTMWRPNGRHWIYLRFWRLRETTSVTNLNLMPFLTFAEGYRASISPEWWLTGVEAGYELWSGGVGIRTRFFSVNLKSKPPEIYVKKHR